MQRCILEKQKYYFIAPFALLEDWILQEVSDDRMRHTER
jgi:hypothetical protein